MNDITVTVITVVYNAIGTIENTIKSVVALKNNNIKYVVIDGGSTDGTVDILSKYKRDIDILVSENDSGIYDAMNKSLKYIESDYFFFLGGDDLLLPGFLLFLKKINKGDNNVYYGNVSIDMKDNKIYGGKFNKIKLLKKNICHQSIFYPNSVAKRFKFNCKYKYLADYDLNIRLFSKYNWLFKDITVAYYNSEGRSSSYRDIYFDEDRKSIFLESYGKYYGRFLIFIRKVFNIPDKINKVLNG